jgi:hypothetical protein
MLEEMATVGEEYIVSWQPHGKAFRVHLPEVFARTVMPRYFKQTKYKSFMRQIQIYGFRRIRDGEDKGAYFHSKFIRNNSASMSLLPGITNQKIKGKNNKGKNNNKSSSAGHHYDAAGDPDSYSLETDVINVLQRLGQQVCTTTSNEEKKKRVCGKRGPASVFGTGGVDPHPVEEKALLDGSLIFNEDVSGDVPSPPQQLVPSPPKQLIGSEEICLLDWLDQAANTIFSRDEEQVSPYNHDALTILRGGGRQKYGDEGIFAGQRFFHVAETEMAFMEDFLAVVGMYSPRSAV